jgi:predicted transcriptional regulator of viral defense system
VNLAQALSRLRGLQVPIFTTSEAAVALRGTTGAASKTLQRLREAALVRSIRRGLWTLDPDLSPLVVPEYLTAPAPSYVSLQTALHLHGMIDQIPSVVYAVTLARTQRVRTALATFSLHRIAPSFFGGFEVAPRTGAKVATPEKALLDVFYLSAGRSRLFSSLPELELPPGFRVREARAWIERIPSSRVRTLVGRRLDRYIS